MERVKLTIAKLDVHLIILGMDILKKLGIMPVLHLGSMMLLSKEATCTVLLVEKKKLMRRQKQLAVMQL